MTFGLSYFRVIGAQDEVVNQIERFSCLAKIELVEQIIQQITKVKDASSIDDETLVTSILRLLGGWQRDLLDKLMDHVDVPVELKEIMEQELDRAQSGK